MSTLPSKASLSRGEAFSVFENGAVLILRDHWLTVPADHSNPETSKTIQVFVREVRAAEGQKQYNSTLRRVSGRSGDGAERSSSSRNEKSPIIAGFAGSCDSNKNVVEQNSGVDTITNNTKSGGKSKKALVYLEGGPGYHCPRNLTRCGWLHRALKDHVVFLMDQRGSGFSTPLVAGTILEECLDASGNYSYHDVARARSRTSLSSSSSRSPRACNLTSADQHLVPFNVANNSMSLNAAPKNATDSCTTATPATAASGNTPSRTSSDDVDDSRDVASSVGAPSFSGTAAESDSCSSSHGASWEARSWVTGRRRSGRPRRGSCGHYLSPSATPARPSTTKAAPSQSGRGVLKEGCTTTSTAVVHSRTDDHDDRSAAALSSQQEASSHRNISTAAASNSTRGGSASAFLGPSQTSGRGGSHHHYLPKVERSAVVSKRSRTPAEQAQFLKYFLADSIVEDLECFRRLYFASTPENSEHQGIGESASGRWSVLGQSYGGFIGVRYLSQYPEALDRVLFTGGLPPPMQCPVDRVYAATCRRLSERNREFYSRYPEDVWRVRVLCKYLELHDIRLPIGGAFGGRLSPRRFLQLGLCLGTQTGLHSMHAVLRSAFEEPFRSVYLRQTMQAASEIQQRAETLAKNITDSYGTVERRDQFRAAAAQLKVLSGAGTGSQAQVIERPVVESSHFQQKEEQAQAQRQPVSSTASTKATRRRRDSVNKRGVCEDADAGAVYSDACSSSFDTSSDDDGRPRDDGCGRRRRRRRRGKLSMDAPPVLDLADLLQNQDQSVNKNTYPEVDQDHIENTPKPKVRMQPDEVSSSAALPGCVPQYLLTPCSCSAHGAFDASTSAATGEAAGGLLKTPKSSPKRPASHEDDNEDSSDERREFVGLGTSCTTQSTPAKALLDVGAKKIGKRRRKAPLEVQSQHWEGEAEHSKSTNICTPRDLFTGTSTSSTSFRSSPLQQHEHSSVNTVLQDQTNASSVFSSAASVTTSSSTPCQSPHQAQPNSQAPLNPPLPQSTVHDRLSTTAPPGPIGTLDLEPNRVSTAASAIGTPGCAGSLVSAPPGTASLMPPPSRTSEILSSEESIMNHPALLLGPRGGAQLSRAFLTAMGNAQPFESQPLYALLQESIYMTEPGCSSGWSAARTIASEQHREDFWYHELKRSCSEDVTTEVGSSSNLVVTSTPLLANTENPTVTMKVNYQHAHDDDISCAAACSPSAYDSTGCAASAFDSTGCACAAALEPAEVATQHQHGNQYDHRNAAPPRTLASQSTPEFPLRWWDDEQFSGRPLFFTSEMVFPWMFSKDFIGLQPLRDCMMALHKETEWPQMYDLSSYQQLHANLRTFLNAEERMIAQYLENEKAVVFTSQEDYTDELVLRPGDPNHARGTSASTSSIEKSQSALSTPGRRDSLSFHSCVEDEVTPGIIRSSPQRVAVVDTKAKNTWTTGCEVLKTGKTSCSSASLYSPCKSTGQHVHPTLLSEQDSAQQSPLLSSTSREDPHAADVKKRVRTTLREIKAPPHCPTCAAVVYYDDMYVERELSEETAAQIPGIRLWVTNEYHHSGLLDDGFVLLDRLLAMCEQAECEEK